jgi:hypothetical protein
LSLVDRNHFVSLRKNGLGKVGTQSWSTASQRPWPTRRRSVGRPPVNMTEAFQPIPLGRVGGGDRSVLETHAWETTERWFQGITCNTATL